MSDENELVSPSFVHLRDLVCPLAACRRKGKSKLHTLISKAQPLCLHSILGHVANVKLQDKVIKDVEHQIDFKLTVKNVVLKVKSNFPQSFRQLEEGTFLKESKDFVSQLYTSGAGLDERIPETCDLCKCALEVWKRKTPACYLITLGGFKKTTFPVKRCPSCRCGYYPDLYSKGLICLHNSVMMSVDFLLDMMNELRAGSSMIETIQLRQAIIIKCFITGEIITGWK